MFHHASSNYIDVEERLDEDRYQELCKDVAAEMDGEWDAEEGFHYPGSADTCPECGKAKSEFIDLWDLTRLASSSRQGGQEWMERLSEGQLEFFEEIVEILHHAEEPIIFRGDLKHPGDVEAWVDGDLPPPELE
jgi:hypothetical protein